MNNKIKLIILSLAIAFSAGCYSHDKCNSTPVPYEEGTFSVAEPSYPTLYDFLPPSPPDNSLDIWITRGVGRQNNDYYGDDMRPIPLPNVDDKCTYRSDIAGEGSAAEMLPAPPSTDVSDTFLPPTYPDYPPIDVHAGVLTAGSFNDALNLEAFKAFWNSNQTNNSFQLPSVDDIQIESRFSGGSKQTIEIAFVLDTTGSMGDELNYLKKELEYISISIKTRHPNVKQRFSLIAYRDQTDQYITTGNHFTEDLPAFLNFLSRQSATGGGDYPEAMHVPLEEAVSKLNWGGQDTAKVLFLIADAPPHNGYVSATLNAVSDLKEKGVHIYPVAASGVADLSERVMRYSALVTGGEYLFITDDSGVGNPHAEPHVPCYEVSHLNELMILKVSEQIAQTSLNLSADKIIRTVGNPDGEGACLP